MAFLCILMSTMLVAGCNGNTSNNLTRTNDNNNKMNSNANNDRISENMITDTRVIESSDENLVEVEQESLIIDTNVKTAEEALQILKQGNRRFVEDDTEIINVSSAKRNQLENGQSPYAIVISCSDSRVSPSHVFNAGLGELFEIRVAGNVLDDYALGSVEYGVEHLGCPLLVVMGHEHCGAVTAAYEAYETNTEVEGAIGELVEAITPSVQAVRGSSIEEASRVNVENTIKELKRNPVVAKAISAGKLEIVGAYYDLDGTVEFFEHES